jgi:hypothetical protein
MMDFLGLADLGMLRTPSEICDYKLLTAKFAKKSREVREDKRGCFIRFDARYLRLAAAPDIIREPYDLDENLDTCFDHCISERGCVRAGSFIARG